MLLLKVIHGFLLQWESDPYFLPWATRYCMTPWPPITLFSPHPSQYSRIHPPPMLLEYFFTIGLSDRETYPFVCIYVISFGANFPVKEPSIVLPGIDVLLSAFGIEWSEGGWENLTWGMNLYGICSFWCPGLESLWLCFFREDTSSLSRVGGRIDGSQFLCSVYIPHARLGTKLLWPETVIP